MFWLGMALGVCGVAVAEVVMVEFRRRRARRLMRLHFEERRCTVDCQWCRWAGELSQDEQARVEHRRHEAGMDVTYIPSIDRLLH